MLCEILNPNVIIPIIIGLHVLGIILTYIITFYHIRKNRFPESLYDFTVLSGLLAVMGGLIFFIYYFMLIRKEQKNNMTKEEFKKEYCDFCGTQRCGGVNDKEWREGCSYYRQFKNELE